MSDAIPYEDEWPEQQLREMSDAMRWARRGQRGDTTLSAGRQVRGAHPDEHAIADLREQLVPRSVIRAPGDDSCVNFARIERFII